MKFKINLTVFTVFISLFTFSQSKIFAEQNSISLNKDSNLDILWTDRIGSGSTAGDSYRSVAQLKDGSIIAVGYSYETPEFETVQYHDGIITSYNINGNMNWVKGLKGDGADFLYTVYPTSDGGFICGGSSNSSDIGLINPTGYDAVIVKYDKDGNKEWINNYGKGYYDDSFNSIIETSTGDYIAVGTENKKSDAIVVKFSSDGDLLWDKKWNSNEDSKFYEVFNSVIETQDGGFICVGFTSPDGYSSTGLKDGLIVKYTNEGEVEWSKSLTGNNDDFFSSIQINDKNEIFVMGSSASTDLGFNSKGGSDVIILKIDNVGETQWIKNLGGNSNDFSTSSTIKDNEIIIVGNSNSTDINAEGTKGYLILKCDFDGNLNFIDIVKTGRGDEEYIYRDVKVLSNETIIVVGDGEVIKGDCIVHNLKLKSQAEIATENAELTNTVEDIETARDLVNKLPESEEKEELQDRLNKIDSNLEFEVKNATANLDVYIKSKNMLSLSLNTNNITFEDFSGIQDEEILNAVTLTINSSLPYEVKAYLPEEIIGTKFKQTMDKRIFNIRASGEEYQIFNDTTTPIILLDNEIKGNKKVHNIDFKLKGNLSHKKDIYKATVKFEVVQK